MLGGPYNDCQVINCVYIVLVFSFFNEILVIIWVKDFFIQILY